MLEERRRSLIASAAVMAITAGVGMSVAAVGSESGSTTSVRAAGSVGAGSGADVRSTRKLQASHPGACGTYSGRGCAPASKRVDLKMPSFSHPTEITNPLFPISRLQSAVLLGQADGKPFRSETTLLPGTAIVVWNGQRIHARISQYMAFVSGRLDEVALDRYAQADDGSVWYLGEDVFDYRRGTVAVTEGTWLAGRDGPAAMIMPAKPKPGDVFRTENTPGVVFEEVTIKSVGKTVEGPHGRVSGAIIGDELHLDGSHSPKTFAPGYGEFLTVEGRDREALALAKPTDSLPGPIPPQLRFLQTAAFAILEDARLKNWEAATPTVKRLGATWVAVKHRAPRLIASRMNGTLRALTRSEHRRWATKVARSALDIARFALDLELRYRPVIKVDIERFHLWTQQLRVDAAAHDLAAVTGDTAVLEWLRVRFTSALDTAGLQQIDASLRGLRAATEAKNLPVAADQAARIGALLRRLTAAR